LLVNSDGKNYQITTIGDLSLVKSSIHCISVNWSSFSLSGHSHQSAILFTLLAAKCQGERCLTLTAWHRIFDIWCADWRNLSWSPCTRSSRQMPPHTS